MPPKRSSGESKQGLVITLVFFILATIGLGVATYFGYSEQEAKDKAKADAEKKLGDMTAERDWYKFQWNLARRYMGVPVPAETATEPVALANAREKLSRKRADLIVVN